MTRSLTIKIAGVLAAFLLTFASGMLLGTAVRASHSVSCLEPSHPPPAHR